MMKQGDIYLVDLNPTLGHEQSGRRPVLVVSSTAFNVVTNAPVVVPITTKGNFARLRGLTVSLDGSGTKTIGLIRCDQLRTLDLKARNAKMLESVPQSILNDVLARLSAIF